MTAKEKQETAQAGSPAGILAPKNMLLAAAVIFAGVLLSLAISMAAPGHFFRDGKKVVYVTYGTGFKKISAEFAAAGLLRSRLVFNLYVVVSGSQKKLKAGEYEFSEGDSMLGIVNKLVKGDVLKHRIVIPEGSDLYDIAEILAENKLADSNVFLGLARDKEFLNSIGIPFHYAEGLLFPDTYYFIIGEGEKKMIETMWARFKEKSIIDISKSYDVAGLAMSGYKVLKMASIIEKEAGLDEERPIIASVFYNRMKSTEAYQRRLESCATVRYALNKKTGVITYKDTKVDSPYNTYIVLGMPPTPISNPGIKSMLAALRPASTDYRYFVVKENGEHTFSETLEQHEAAKTAYKKKRKAER
jgi:UPF0755 protein